MMLSWVVWSNQDKCLSYVMKVQREGEHAGYFSMASTVLGVTPLVMSYLENGTLLRGSMFKTVYMYIRYLFLASCFVIPY